MSFQKCPLCKSKGVTKKKETCPVCNGELIISEQNGLPPSKNYFYYPTQVPVYPYPWETPYPIITYITSDTLN